MILAGFLTFIEQVSSSFEGGFFPIIDHGGMDLVFYGQLCNGFFISDSAKGHFGLKRGAILSPFFAHCRLFSNGCGSELNTLSSFWGPPHRPNANRFHCLGVYFSAIIFHNVKYYSISGCKCLNIYELFSKWKPWIVVIMNCSASPKYETLRCPKEKFSH